MLDFENVSVISTLMIIAKSPAVLKNKGKKLSELDKALIDFIYETAETPIFWVMKDKNIKQAAKNMAEHTKNQMAKVTNNLEFRTQLSEGVLSIIKVLVGVDAFEKMDEKISEVAELIKHQNSMNEEMVANKIMEMSVTVRKELSEAGLYKGKISL